MSDDPAVVIVVPRSVLTTLTDPELRSNPALVQTLLPTAVKAFESRSVKVTPAAGAPYSRQVSEAIFDAVVDVTESQYEVREVHPNGESAHFSHHGHESVFAQALLPRFNGSRFWHLMKHYRHFISDYR